MTSVDMQASQIATAEPARAYGPQSARAGPLVILKRTVALASDAVVLTVAAPFIGGWFVYKAVKRWFGAA